MHRLFFILFALFLASCSGRAHLQRVMHQTPDMLIVLDKGEINASPSFSAPYQHPQTLSEETLQKILEGVHVVPSHGFLNDLFVGKERARPLFDSDTAQILSIQLSQALAKADPSERINFFHALPSSSQEVLATSGFLLFKDNKIHIRVNSYRVPLRRGRPLTSVGNALPPSEMTKYRFTLLENKQMVHRRYKKIFDLEGTDDQWLVIDPTASPDPQAPSHDPALEIEEKLQTLKNLKEKGLISEEDYIEKKRSLLQAF